MLSANQLGDGGSGICIPVATFRLPGGEEREDLAGEIFAKRIIWPMKKPGADFLGEVSGAAAIPQIIQRLYAQLRCEEIPFEFNSVGRLPGAENRLRQLVGDGRVIGLAAEIENKRLDLCEIWSCGDWLDIFRPSHLTSDKKRLVEGSGRRKRISFSGDRGRYRQISNFSGSSR